MEEAEGAGVSAGAERDDLEIFAGLGAEDIEEETVNGGSPDVCACRIDY